MSHQHLRDKEHGSVCRHKMKDTCDEIVRANKARWKADSEAAELKRVNDARIKRELAFAQYQAGERQRMAETMAWWAERNPRQPEATGG